MTADFQRKRFAYLGYPPVVRAACCPDARSAQEAQLQQTKLTRPVACGHPGNTRPRGVARTTAEKCARHRPPPQEHTAQPQFGGLIPAGGPPPGGGPISSSGGGPGGGPFPGSIPGGGPGSSCGRAAASGTGTFAVGTSCEIVTAGGSGAAKWVEASSRKEPPAVCRPARPESVVVEAGRSPILAIEACAGNASAAGTSIATVTAAPAGAIAT